MRDTRRFPTHLAVTLLVLAIGISGRATAQQPLTLQVNDADARPGGVMAVVLRTYTSRQLGQGQVGFRGNQGLRSGAGIGPDVTRALFSGFLGAVVFSDQDDAVNRVEIGPGGGGAAIVLSFASLSASINQSDGPLAVLYFRVSNDAVIDTRIDLTIDPLSSFLTDELGNDVPIAVASGRLRILAPNDPFGISANAEDTIPGTPAVLSLQTPEALPLSAGQAAFVFDPFFVDGPAVVNMDPRYGDANYTVDDSTPGLIIVTYESPDNSLNRVPGDFITVTIPTRSDIAPGTMTPIDFDPNLTFLLDKNGQELTLSIEPDILVFN